MVGNILSAIQASVAFINEVASICEAVGADAKDVEHAMKSDHRIGPGAYLTPGAAFGGGTLARDLAGPGPELELIARENAEQVKACPGGPVILQPQNARGRAAFNRSSPAIGRASTTAICSRPSSD